MQSELGTFLLFFGEWKWLFVIQTVANLATIYFMYHERFNSFLCALIGVCVCVHVYVRSISRTKIIQQYCRHLHNHSSILRYVIVLCAFFLNKLSFFSHFFSTCFWCYVAWHSDQSKNKFKTFIFSIWSKCADIYVCTNCFSRTYFISFTDSFLIFFKDFFAFWFTFSWLSSFLVCFRLSYHQ